MYWGKGQDVVETEEKNNEIRELPMDNVLGDFIFFFRNK